MSNLPWMDLETTGLRADKDAILEIGIMITNTKLEMIDSMSWVLSLKGADLPIGEIDPFVWRMHTKSGLWQECLESGVSLDQAVIEARKFITNHDAWGQPACGSSIHFDRGFTKLQAPLLDEAFHYRNIDVSTLKNMVALWHPDIYALRPSDESKRHRTLDDLIYSVQELRFYAQELDWSLV